MPTHKKGHDKDKYYHLAKDQGFRSRASFKLIQINKRYDFLSKAKVCIDLCAAPGGWCQVAAKAMKPGSIILGVDLLPIRDIRNVKTIVSDITTPECRRLVAQELQGWKADVVLCDGAPNIGAEYKKDAYVQNELVLAALKTATDHLAEGGTFCTKIYRSQDYNALIWVFQQLFEDVQAVKPNSSRSQSSEIFLVCMKYTAPNRIDPKLLDPNHVFKEVVDPGLQTVDVLHKKYDKLNKRHRTGYDASLGMTLTLTKTVSDFIESSDAVRMLTDANNFVFSDSCQRFLNHPQTTKEMIECFKDLRVLGKIDFKKMLKWRQQMKVELEAERIDSMPLKEITEEIEHKHDPSKPLSDEQIQIEISEMHAKLLQEEKRSKKKDRKVASKLRERRALGMSSDSFGVEEDEELFSLDPSMKLVDLERITDVALEDEDFVIPRDRYEDAELAKQEQKGAVIVSPDEEDLEDQLEDEYKRFIRRRKAKDQSTAADDDIKDVKDMAAGTNRVASDKKARASRDPKQVIKKKAEEDDEFMQHAEKKRTEALTTQYVNVLSQRGSDDSDSFSDDDDDNNEDHDFENDAFDEDDEEINIPAKKRSKTSAASSKSIVAKDEYTNVAKAEKWFSHPIFKETLLPKNTKNRNRQSESDDEENEYIPTAAEMLKLIPRSDREIRNEKRKHVLERKERRDQKKRVVDHDEDSKAFTITSNSHEDFSNRLPKNSVVHNKEFSYIDDDNSDTEGLDNETIKKRDLIRRGMGSSISSNKKDRENIEIVPQDDDEDIMQRHDSRTYDSDDEEYDTHDRATTLALGTLMLRQSKKKALVDASYNRFTWNDPNDLPSWFMDDEMKHNKPLLPVPTALIDQIKGKYNLTGTKEIKKVAEARARKRKRAMAQLKTARKTANAMADNSELSEKQKLRAIAKAIKGSKSKTPGKVLVVTKKTGGASSGTMGAGKGKLKFVDKRSKKDKRSENVLKAKAKRGRKKK